MSVLLCKRYTCVLIVILISIFKMTTSTTSESPDHLSGDFENFLQGLGSMVYKYKKPTRAGDGRQRTGHEYSRSTAGGMKSIARKTQKDALKDVLMMKLVSYYEDKYKITHQEGETQIKTTNIPTFNDYTIKSIYGGDHIDQWFSKGKSKLSAEVIVM